MIAERMKTVRIAVSFIRYGIWNAIQLRRCEDFDGNPLGWRRGLKLAWIAMAYCEEMRLEDVRREAGIESEAAR